MVAAAERAPDRRQRRVGELAREVHGDLARPGRRPAARLGETSSSSEMSKSWQMRRWISSTERAARAQVRVEAAEHLLGERRRDRPAGQRAEGDDADQRALERADVGVDALGDQLERARARRRATPSCCTRLRRIVRRVAKSGGRDVADQAGLEALAQPVLERVDVARQAVGGQHELGAGGVSALKVWKNSSSVLALLWRNWTSSTSSTSTSR